MAQSAIVNIKDDRPRHSMAVVRIDWTADAGGAFDQILDCPMFGSITHIYTKPGSTAPTDASDVTLKDDSGTGADVLAAQGTDILSATLVVTKPMMTEATVGSNKYGVNPSIATMRPRLTISNNAVANATGTIWIYLR